MFSKFPTPSHSGLVKLGAFCLALFALAAVLLFFNPFQNSSPPPAESPFPGITLALTAEAGEALQQTGQAFPKDSAGFSAYYRVGSTGNYRLNKAKVDGYIFSKIESGETTLRASPAVLVQMGANYTIATLPLLNIDDLVSPVNLYYDDQGWVVAYLPRHAPPSQVWQARGTASDPLDVGNPTLTTIHLTLLDAINVVVKEALNHPFLVVGDLEGYYHWQHPTANKFLMMGVARSYEGGSNEPVSFAVPNSLNVAEVSATMWIVPDTDDGEVPCAKMILDGADLIPKKCERNLFHTSANLYRFGGQASHVFTLLQTKKNASDAAGLGATGALLMLVYSQPDTAQGSTQ